MPDPRPIDAEPCDQKQREILRAIEVLRNIGKHSDFVPVCFDEIQLAPSPSPMRSDGITMGDVRSCWAVAESLAALDFGQITDERNTLRTLLQSLLITIHKDQRVIESYASYPQGIRDQWRIATDDAVDIVAELRKKAEGK